MRNQLKIFLPILLLIISAFTIFSVYQSRQFKITQITPNNRSYPASLNVINIKFNRNLVTDSQNSFIQTSFPGKSQVTISDTSITILFKKTPIPGKYLITIENIKAKDGSHLTKKIPLIVKDIPYKKLTTQEKKLYNSFSNDVADEEYYNIPILQDLPYETDKYLISGSASEGSTIAKVTITMKFFAPGNNAVPAAPEEQAAYINNVRTYRNEALQWIQSKGFNLDDFYLVYSEPDIQNEFPKGKQQ